METVDKQPGWPGWLCAVGPELASDLLGEGLATTTPKWQRRLIDVALRALAGPVPLDPRGLARGLTATVGTGNNLMYVRSALKTALAGTPQAQEVAATLVHLGDFGSTLPGMPKKTGQKARPDPKAKPVSVGELLRQPLDQIEAISDALATVESALTELGDLKMLRNPDGYLAPMARDPAIAWSNTVNALRDAEASVTMELLCGELSPESWPIAMHLAHAAWPGLSRPPVGHLLSGDIASTVPN